jgi:hypothetical protein
MAARFVPRGEFAATSRNAPTIDLAAFRADQDAAADHDAEPQMADEAAVPQTER